MADQDIKDFTVNWVLVGLLVFSLLGFTMVFLSSNNPNALGDMESNFENTYTKFSNSLIEIELENQDQLEVSSELNSESAAVTTQGAASTSYSFMGSAKEFWQSSKVFLSWIFTGTMGNVLIAVISGLFGIIGLYYIIRLLRRLI